MSSGHKPDSNVELRSEEYRKLATLLHQWTGIRLQAKEHLMSGRVGPRLRQLGLSRYRDYLQLLEEQGRDGAEAQTFINALTTNKTAFFREAHHFTFLVERVFAELRERAADGGGRKLRLWSAGCSRGAEPYTMALLAAEHLPAAQGWDVRILATDLDTNVLREAERGEYALDELADVPAALRRRWFREGQDSASIHPDAAALVTFKRANLIASPFPVKGRFDAIFCRNVMIYFDRPTQENLVAEFCRLIARHGHLVIGHSESLLGQNLQREDVVGVYRPHAGTARGRSSRSPQPTAAGTGRSLSAPAPGKRRSRAAPASPSRVPAARRSLRTAPARHSRAPKPAPPSRRSLRAQPALAPTRRSRAPAAKSAARHADALPPPPPTEAARLLPSQRRAAQQPPAATPARKRPMPDLPERRIVLGEWFTASEPSLVGTLLGSCVAACLFDATAGVGGMNHFMLPSSQDDNGTGARFGVHAMEILINELMRKGADRKRLAAKAFGAAAVNSELTSTVAEQNGTFIREFLAREKIPLLIERLGGHEAREVYMRTDNGEAFVRRIAKRQAEQLERSELDAWRRLSMPPPAAPFNPDDALF
jgi:chemotaxis protein methyltransferase CheR